MQSNHPKQDYQIDNQNQRVKISNTLIQKDLLDLILGKYLALRIPNYYPRTEALTISQLLVQQQSLERYLRAPDIGVQRSSITFFEINGNLEILELYYQKAAVSAIQLRETCFPYLSPIDKLRLDLTDIYSQGAAIENVHQRKMLSGIARVFEDSSELPPHQDILLRDILDSGLAPIPDYEELVTQLSSNIYLQIPKIGGELEIWDIKPSFVEQQAIRDKEYKYEGIVDRENLPASAVMIKPEVGDLILFDSGKLHAVRPSQKELRVSVSMFVGYRGEDKQLTYWS
jgi:2OG-Fe(II) oxygenase superfamily